MKYKHKEPEIKKKKPRKRIKKNNAHLIPKDKLFMQAKWLEEELIFHQKPIKKNKRPIKYY